MDVQPRFAVVLATTGHPVRQRLLRLLSGSFCVKALRADAQGAVAAVHARLPDVLVCDARCSAGVLGSATHAWPPTTWMVVLADDDEQPAGVSRIGERASDRRLLDAVATAGALARSGARTRAPRVPVVPVAGLLGTGARPTEPERSVARAG